MAVETYWPFKTGFLILEGISDHLDLDSAKEISLPAPGNLLNLQPRWASSEIEGRLFQLAHS